MLRSNWIPVALAIAAVGCGRSVPPPPPPVSTPPAVATAGDPSLPPNPAAAPTTAAPPAVAPSASGGGLGELLAKYLDADGQGGYRPNEKAATELERLAPQASQLSPLLTDPQVEVRRGAAFFLLSLFDPANSDHVSALTSLLADDDRAIRSIGRAAVAEMRPADQVAAVPKLAALLAPDREAKADNRAAIARLFGSLKSEAAPALAALAKAAASDPDAKVRAACYAALVQVAPPADAIAPLEKGLTDADAAVRVVATAQLRKLFAAAAPAASSLAKALGDSDQRVRENATEALILIGKPAVEPLIVVLGGQQALARKYALAALGKIGPHAKAAIPAIEKCRTDSDPEAQKLAEQALKQIGLP